ncbi:MAG: hypothetical protein ABJP33_16840 [Pseudoruegeria sp.]
MPAPYTADQIALMESPFCMNAFFCSIDWPAGPVYLWTGVGEIAALGSTWLGIGALGSISTNDAADISQRRRTTLKMRGMPAEHAEVIEEDRVRNRVVELYHGVGRMVSGRFELEGDPILYDAGGIDGVSQSYEQAQKGALLVLEWVAELEVSYMQSPLELLSQVHSLEG